MNFEVFKGNNNITNNYNIITFVFKWWLLLIIVTLPMNDLKVSISFLVQPDDANYTSSLVDGRGELIELESSIINDVYRVHTRKGLRLFDTLGEAKRKRVDETKSIEHLLQYKLFYREEDFDVNYVYHTDRFTNYDLLKDHQVTFRTVTVCFGQMLTDDLRDRELISLLANSNFEFQHTINDLIVINDSVDREEVKLIQEKLDVKNTTLHVKIDSNCDLAAYKSSTYDSLVIDPLCYSCVITCSEKLSNFKQVTIYGSLDSIQSLINIWCNTKVVSIAPNREKMLYEILETTDYKFESVEVVYLAGYNYNLSALFPNAEVHLCSNVEGYNFRGTGVIRDLGCLDDTENLHNKFDKININDFKPGCNITDVDRFTGLTLSLTKSSKVKSARTVV